MERNANYALVGLASTLLLIGTIVFIVWLAQFKLHQDYDLYDVVFHGPVRGLSTGGEVHFNGIKVGEVTKIKLDKVDPNLVIATAKVTSDVPIRADSFATLEPQGITGVNYVQITAGSVSRPLLKDSWKGGGNPRIPSKRDAFSDLLAGGGDVLQKMSEALNRVNRVLSDDNIKHFSGALSDVQSVTAELNARKSVIADAQKALQNVSASAAQIKILAGSANTLVTTDGKRTVVKLGDAAEDIEKTSQSLRGILNKLDGPTSDFASTGLPQLTSSLASLQQATDHLDRLLGEIETNPRGLIGKTPPKEVEVKP